MLTNFSTIRKSLKKMSSVGKVIKDISYQNLAKREKLMLNRERSKLERLLGGISNLTRLPGALFIVDINKEHIAVKEARKIGIVTFGIVDTNVNPNYIDYPIPGNDDSFKSVSLIIKSIGSAIEEGLIDRQKDKVKYKK
jgi:small subunit ribosomal protein S2